MNNQSKAIRHLIRLLRRLNKRRARQDEGYILVVVISLLLATLLLFTAYSLLTRSANTTTLASVDSNSGFYDAEAGLNLRADELRQTFRNYNQPSGTSPASYTACLNPNAGSQGTGDFACKSYQLNTALFGGQKHTAFTYTVPQNNGQPTPGVVPLGEPFQNLNMQEYGYQVYAVAQKAGTSTREAILEMDIKSRLVPMFQFAAFFANDLEILPSPHMDFGGPIHSNGDLYFGAQNGLYVRGQLTLVKNQKFYNKRKDNNSTSPYGEYGQVQIATDAAGTTLKNVLDATGSQQPTTSALPETGLSNGWGNQIEVGVDPVTLPAPSFLNTAGDYYNKADLQIQYKPNKSVPFTITTINRSLSTPLSVTIDPADPDPVKAKQYEGQLRSLMQPVLAGPDLASAGICQVAPPILPASLSSLSQTQLGAIVKALQVAIVSQPTPVAFSLVSTSKPLNDSALSGVKNTLLSLITTLNLGLNPLQQIALTMLTPAQIATLTGQCFVSAPIQNIPATFNTTLASNVVPIRAIPNTPLPVNSVNGFVVGQSLVVGTDSNNYIIKDIDSTSNTITLSSLLANNQLAGTVVKGTGFHNNREGRDINLLQLNLKGLAVWNRDGIYVAFNNGTMYNNNSGKGFSTDQLLFTRATSDSNAPAKSFQNLGLAAADITEGGLVFYASIDPNFTANDNSKPYASAATNQSLFGFAITGGDQLLGLAKYTGVPSSFRPHGLTLASDQAIYIQGDYNYNSTIVDSKNILLKQPAAILADSINILSNACIDSNGTPTTFYNTINCGINNVKPPAKSTKIFSAFLSGTDITNGGDYSGGLENYPRFHESWSNQNLTYNGSFVSLGTPLHVSGRWGTQVYDPPGRTWTYDTDFNDANNLPPLSPRFVYLRQQQFIRTFN